MNQPTHPSQRSAGDPCAQAISRARALIDLKKWQLAVVELSLALQHNPNSEPAHYWMGFCFYRMANYRRARREVRSAIGINPEYAPAYWLSAIVDLQTRQHRAAERAIKKALEINPENATFHATNGSILLAVERYDKALAAAEHALRLAPDNQTAGSVKTIALAALGRHDEAAAQANNLLESAPGSANAWYQKGHQLFVQGKLEESREALLESLRLDPEMKTAQIELAKVLSARGGFFSLFWQWTLFLMRFPPNQRPLIVVAAVFVGRSLVALRPKTPGPHLFSDLATLAWLLLCLYMVLAHGLFRLAIRKGWIR